MGKVENAVELVAVVSVVVHHVREVDARRWETALHAYEESVDKHLVTQTACHFYESHKSYGLRYNTRRVRRAALIIGHFFMSSVFTGRFPYFSRRSILYTFRLLRRDSNSKINYRLSRT